MRKGTVIMSQYYVYALINPLVPRESPDHIFYIGQTNHPSRRLGYHLLHTYNGEGAKDRRIIILRIFQETLNPPLMIIIARKLTRNEILVEEKRLTIEYLQKGYNLTGKLAHDCRESLPLELVEDYYWGNYR